MDLKTQILKALGLEKDVEVKLEYQAKLTDGTIIVSSADDLVAGSDVSILAEDGTTMPLPVGNYEVEDGTSFTVEEEGIVAEIAVVEEEVVEEEAEKEEEDYKEEEVEMNEEIVEEVTEPSEVEEATTPKKIKTTEEIIFNKEEVIAEIGAVIKELLTEVKNDVSRLSSELDEMKNTNETLEIEKETLSAQLEAVSKEPAADPVTTNKFATNKKDVTPVEYRKMTRQEKFLYNLNNN
jgi:regulator of replication initiation timing